MVAWLTEVLSRDLANKQRGCGKEWTDGTWDHRPSLARPIYLILFGSGPSGQNLVVPAVPCPDSKDSPAVSCHPRPVDGSSGSTGFEA